MRSVIRQTIPFYLSLVVLTGVANAAVKVDSNTFGAIEARSIGPAVMSGRIMAIEAVASDPRIIYVGAASGGVWKSMNYGTKFKPVFDKYSQSIGSIAIDQTHPDTVWVGTGEGCTRNSVSVGTGIYKTTDAGDNWKLMGLENSERISKILIDPKNSNTVYVAVPGHLWNSSEDRGVYKTSDGGQTWQKILYVDADTGAADIAIDPQEPSILYASMWQFRRLPYFFTSGGSGSGLYKSTDAGKTWKKIQKGLPEGELGRIAIAVAPSRPNVLYANVESKNTALYRSNDTGESWTLVNSSFNVVARPFYFSHLAVDPKDFDRVYKPGFSLSVSTDGGQSMSGVNFAGPHSDHHALWINPMDPTQLLLGTDGGVYASRDKGVSWIHLRNLPVSQFYHVTYDMEQPYNVYGGLQDNGSWTGPSQSSNGIENKDWTNVGFGDGFYTFPDPTNNDIVFSQFQGGNMLRHYKSTKETKFIKPFEKEGEPKYRFNWNTAFEISPKNPNAIYVGAQFLFRSTNKGDSWERISDDLTTNDPAKQKQDDSGGLTPDNSSAENYCTIYTVSASPLEENLIWAGTDDGNLQLTQDGGKSWTNVVGNIPGLPKNTWCSSVEASNRDAGTAFVTFDGHRTGDMKTYIFKTTDYGKTWSSIVSDGLKGYAYIVREDLVNPNLLFAGTESGLFISLDGGQQWAQFTGQFPVVPVNDLAIHPRESDLIIATHGRGIYIIDDITPLRKLTPEIMESKVTIMESRPSRIQFPAVDQEFPGDDEFVGRNLTEDATITYWLKERHVFGDLKVEVYDSEGKLLNTLPGGKRKGINRVEWSMRMKPPKVPPAPTLAFGATVGPTVPEGTYTVKLIKGEETYTGKIELQGDPRLKHSAEDRRIQQQTVMKLYQMQERLAFVNEVVVDAMNQAKERAVKLKKGDGFAKTLNAFADQLDALHKTLVATKPGFLTGEEQLREKVVELYQAVTIYGGKPTDSLLDRIQVLEKQIEKANASFESIIGKELNAINNQLQNKKMEPIKVLTKEDYDKKHAND